ncbi:MAG: ABC transporter permease [Pseudomonadota bacterium]
MKSPQEPEKRKWLRVSTLTAVRSIPFSAGAGIALLLILVAILSLFWTPHDPTKLSVRERLQGPSLEYLLGTDHFGRDIFSMLMVGAQSAVGVGVVAVGIGMLFGVGLGLVAAAWPSRAGGILLRGSDLVFAFPPIISAIIVTALLGPGAINAIIAIGIFNIPVFLRLTRGAAAQIWHREFILAAQATGKGRLRISLDHILPNIAPILVVQATIQFALAILADAGLSYLGFGVQPPASSWGRMLNEAQSFMFTNPTLAVWPGLAIALVVLGLNLLGDGLRDLVDPRLARVSSEIGGTLRG